MYYDLIKEVVTRCPEILYCTVSNSVLYFFNYQNVPTFGTVQPLYNNCFGIINSVLYLFSSVLRTSSWYVVQNLYSNSTTIQSRNLSNTTYRGNRAYSTRKSNN